MYKAEKRIHQERSRFRPAGGRPATADDAAAGLAPGDVSPGANSIHGSPQRPPSEGSHVGIDWYRATGAASQMEKVVRLLDLVFGEDSTPRGGRYNFREGREWPSTAAVYWTHTAKQIRLGTLPNGQPMYTDGSYLMCVDLPGGALNLLSGEDRVRLVAEIWKLGLKGTRLDVFIDFVGPGAADLIDNAHKSCQRGELCGARRFRPISNKSGQGKSGPRWVEESPEYTLESDHRVIRRMVETVGKGLSIGRRGKNGSGRFERFYDKGLETGLAAEGEWVRGEVEFTGDCAFQAAAAIACAFLESAAAQGEDDGPSGWGLGGWVETAVGLVLGAVDFRENNGEKEMSRRPRVKWWAELVDGVKLKRVVADRIESTLRTKVNWIVTAVLPWLDRVGETIGEGLDGVADLLAGSDRRQAKADPALFELMARLEHGGRAGWRTAPV